MASHGNIGSGLRRRGARRGGGDAVRQRRRRLEGGWRGGALLRRVVRARRGDGPAVLTAKTALGKFILNTQSEEILLGSDPGSRFVRRQSQSAPTVGVGPGDIRPARATA